MKTPNEIYQLLKNIAPAFIQECRTPEAYKKHIVIEIGESNNENITGGTHIETEFEVLLFVEFGTNESPELMQTLNALESAQDILVLGWACDMDYDYNRKNYTIRCKTA